MTTCNECGAKIFDPYLAQARKIQEKTNLSKREAEIYCLTENLGYTIEDAAKKMNISYGNASKKRGRIKEKIKLAEKTAKLQFN